MCLYSIVEYEYILLLLLLLLLLLQMELEDAGHIVQVQEVFLAVL